MSRRRSPYKYVLLILGLIAFGVYIIFFDKNSLIERSELKEEIEALEKQADYYRANITADSTLLENLKEDDFLERYARENFLMREKDETIIVIE